MANLSTIIFQSLTPSSLDVNGHALSYPFTSEKAKGCGFYRQPDALHSVQYSTINNFTGQVKMQGTLAENPTEEDWYDITETILGNGTSPVFNQTLLINFTGNHVWVRGVIVNFASGTLNNVLYSHN